MTNRDEAISKAKDLSRSLVCVNTREQAVQWMADACVLLDGLEAFCLAAKAKGAEEAFAASINCCEDIAKKNRSALPIAGILALTAEQTCKECSKAISTIKEKKC